MMYQSEYKEKFMRTSRVGEIYQWLFDKSSSFEEEYNKDLYDFDKGELLSFLSSREMTKKTLGVHLSYISTYIKWAIKEGITASNANPTQKISKGDLSKIAKKPPKVLHSSKIYEIVGAQRGDNYPRLKNAQDKLLIYLIFLGIRGRGASQLINLKYEDIDVDDKVIRLSNIDPNYSDVKVDDHCIKLAKDAKREIAYVRYEREGKGYMTVEKFDVIESEYVFRKSGHQGDDGDVRLSQQGILRRIATLAKFLGEHLTMKLIQDSGMARVGYLLYKSGEELSASNPMVQEFIFDRYGVSENEQGRWNTMKKVRENVKNVYLSSN